MRLSSSGLLLLVAGAGCTGTVSGSPEAADAETTTAMSAVIVVERTSDSVQGSSAEASARFVRVTTPSSSTEALQAIGAALDLPPRGACASIASLAGFKGTPGSAASAPARAPVVELVDVGPVSLEADGLLTRLLPRQLPDVTDVVSGVVYARATGPALLPPATNYVVHVAGGHDLASFDVVAAAPHDPSEVRVAGETPGGLKVGANSSIELAWAPDGTEDFLYVDVRPNGVRCVFDDVGRGTVSPFFFDDAGTLVIHRVHRERFRVRGIDAGEVRFDFSRAIPYLHL
jgi:hypothetical protein